MYHNALGFRNFIIGEAGKLGSRFLNFEFWQNRDKGCKMMWDSACRISNISDTTVLPLYLYCSRTAFVFSVLFVFFTLLFCFVVCCLNFQAC